jgi:DNA invertase Pin-like site-specific DNA recombinase
MIYGYARVSTEAQDLTGSTAQLKAAGCDKIYREKITGTTADRPQLKKLVSVLAQDDVVIVPAVDRLSRDTTDLLNIARDMQKAGAGIRSWPSRSLIPRPILPRSFSRSSALPRSWNIAASRSARPEAAPTPRRRVSNLGASRNSPPNQQREARKRIEDGETQRSVARSYNVSQTTISRLGNYEIAPPGEQQR